MPFWSHNDARDKHKWKNTADDGGWNKENYCDSPHLRGKIDGFLRDGNRIILNRNTNGSRCDICVQTVGPV